MKDGFFILVGSVVFSLLFSIVLSLISRSSRRKTFTNDKMKIQDFINDISVNISNATVINQSSSSPNRPVRSKGETYSWGLLKEIGKQRGASAPENILINIRNKVRTSDNLGESHE